MVTVSSAVWAASPSDLLLFLLERFAFFGERVFFARLLNDFLFFFAIVFPFKVLWHLLSSHESTDVYRHEVFAAVDCHSLAAKSPTRP